MSRLTHHISQRWAATGLAGRVWWTAMASVATAAVLALAAVTMADATGPSPSTTASAASAPSMNMSSEPTVSAPTVSASKVSAPKGSASKGSASMGSMGSSSTTTGRSSPTCPNVKHTTVMSNGMVMAPVPSTPPTASQRAAAATLAASVKTTLTKYASLSAATAAGYVPATPPSGRVVHYANWQTVRDGIVLNPNDPPFLVYANTLRGPELLGAMFLGPGPCQPGPDIGGSLTQWHAHDNLCLSATHQVVGKTGSNGSCSTGTHNDNTYFMLHVWVQPSLAATHQFQADLTRSELVPIIIGNS
jgi:hypothetical protein